MSHINNEYFLRKLVLRWVLKNGDLNLISDRILVGLGCGHAVLYKYLHNPENVTGEAKTIEVYTGTVNSTRISTVAIPGGGIYVEWIVRIAALRKAKAIIGVGFCGGIAENIELGDIVVPIAAVRDEDTTDHYVSKKMPAVGSFNLIRKIVEKLENNWNFHVGIVVTTSSSLTETTDWIRTWQNMNVLAVDCETSVFLLLSHIFRIPSAVMLVVSDHAVKKTSYYDSPQLSKKIESGFATVIKTALSVLSEK